MALTTKKAKKVLTKTEQNHLTFSGINSIAAFTKSVEQQKNDHKIVTDGKPDAPVMVGWCETCWMIAKKLGMETV